VGWYDGIWLLSSTELPRLVVPPAVALRLSAIVLVAAAVDEALTRRSRQAGGAAT